MAHPGLSRPRSRNQNAQIPQSNNPRVHSGRASLPYEEVTRTRLGHDSEGAKITLNEYLDRWLKTAVKPRVREKTCQDYDGMLRRYIRPSLGETILATMQPMDVQTACQKMTERGHRRVASNSLGSSCGPLHTSILQESCRASSGITGCRSPGLYSPFSYP